MKKVVFSTAVAIAFAATAASAADLKPAYKAPPPPVVASPWDIAFGAAIMNDYVFRGVTQSNHKGSVAAYFEPRFNISPNLQLYTGISGESISFPNRAAAEIDFYGGIRPTFGPVALDFGFWYYYYPGGTCFNAAIPGECAANGNIPINGNVIKNDLSFWEVYAKGTYTINDSWALGANFYYTPSFLNSDAEGEYLSGTVKYTGPGNFLPYGIGFYISGEFGRQWLGTSDSFYGVVGFPNGIPYADYNTWNVGLGFTWKVFTLDLRYSDTNLSKADCNAFTSDWTATFSGDVSAINPGGFGSKWCGSTFIAKFSADLTLGSLKP